MTDTNLPAILIDRAKIAAVFKLHIQMHLRTHGYSHAQVARAIEIYGNEGLARIDDIVAQLLSRRRHVNEYGPKLIEPTIGDIARFKGASHYTIQVCGDLPKGIRDVLHEYLATK